MLIDRALCWLRRDLRLDDHTALAAACGAARAVAVVFIFDTTILDRLADRDDRRVVFIHRSLCELDAQLRERGSLLLVRHGDPRTEIPQLAAEFGAGAVFTNHDYEPDARERDAAVAWTLEEQGCELHTYKDQVIYESEEILTAAGRPYTVFTPYRRAWLARLEVDADVPLAPCMAELSRLAPNEMLEPLERSWRMQDIGFRVNTLWQEPGARAARARFESFAGKMERYHELRDYPAAGGTSGLSVHLRFGTISIREAVRRARSTPGDGAAAWLSELVWREFAQMILDRFPHVAERAFKPEFDRIAWEGTDDAFAAWCEGRTGYPLVDAAMRHLNATGWMHNRLRMVTASFLTKDLLVDYRRGEAYFARRLLDFDLAANNCGWQWSASTGCDAQPYFRIFNPVTQSQRFDAAGAWIREMCPELGGFNDRDIHWPAGAGIEEQRRAGCIVGEDYPAPIVEHAVQRARALAMYKAAGSGSV